MQIHLDIPYHRLEVTSPPRLLSEFQGKLLIVRSKGKIEILRLDDQHRSQLAVIRFAAVVCSSNVRYFMGVLTSKGGRFQAISQEEAFRRIARWLIKMLTAQLQTVQ